MGDGRYAPCGSVPWRLRGLSVSRPNGRRVPVAERTRARLLGLAFLTVERAGPGLLIPRTRSIHTFGMRFGLTVVFLDRAGRETSRRECMRPNRIAFDRRADAVLEYPARGGGAPG